MSRKIAVILDELFEDDEYAKPVEAFKKAGHGVEIIGLKKGKKVKGKRGRVEAIIEKSVDEAEPERYDALLIPGGYSPDKLRAHENAVNFVREFFNRNKPIFAICHGPQLLISADALKGRKVTGWKSIRKDIENAGAVFIDKSVVIDGNLITSRHPGDIPYFIKACLKKLENE